MNIFQPSSSQPTVFSPGQSQAQSEVHRRETNVCPSNLTLACPFCGDSTSWADCKCLNYSRVFNARNSFASIAQQSTPLPVQHANVRGLAAFVETSASDDLESQFCFTPQRPSSITHDYDSDLVGGSRESATEQGSLVEENYGSQAFSQLASQLSECVLSPCVKLRECNISTSDSKQSLTESLSLGYIPTAFPEETF